MAITLYKFILETYSETELLVLCESDDKLKEVKAEFSDSLSLGEKTRRLIDFCGRRGLSEALRHKIKDERKEQWENYKMPEKDPDSNIGRMQENKREVEGIFKELKAIETMDIQEKESEASSDTTHPLTQDEFELKKWFSENLDTDEQVFFLTSALFSGLEKHEFMKLYDGINDGLQADEKREEKK